VISGPYRDVDARREAVSLSRIVELEGTAKSGEPARTLAITPGDECAARGSATSNLAPSGASSDWRIGIGASSPPVRRVRLVERGKRFDSLHPGGEAGAQIAHRGECGLLRTSTTLARKNGIQREVCR
jgi:hypothetical protein